MNGVPMKFDYSKTINEQLSTFDYYKDRYCSYELELINDRKEIKRLNNIINGMEKFFQYAYDNEVRPLNDRKVSVWTICLDKLQELKGSDSNE